MIRIKLGGLGRSELIISDEKSSTKILGSRRSLRETASQSVYSQQLELMMLGTFLTVNW